MNRKIITSTVFLAVFSLNVFAQEDKDWESKTYEVGEFSQVVLDGSFKVYLIQGEDCSVNVKATNSDVFDNIKIRRNQGEVSIQLDESFFKYRGVSLYITFKTLEKLNIKGAVNLKTNGYLNLENLSMRVEGGANIELNMKARNVDVYGEGGFLFELKGVADKLAVIIKGAGHVGASELKTKDVNFQVAGFGTGSVYATDYLNARIEGVGKLRYKGHPKVDQYIDGLGSVKPY